jgi:hypothetical protein
MEEEQDPAVKAAQDKAIKAREERDEAEKRVKEADGEVERIKATKQENLDGQDQGAIQGATQSGINAR